MRKGGSIMRQIALLVALLACGLVVPRLAHSDSCDAYPCQSGCICNQCSCAKDSSNDTSVGDHCASGMSTRTVYLGSSTCGPGGVQVTGAWSAPGITNAELIVTVYDFNNSQFARVMCNQNCTPSTTLTIAPGSIPFDPRTAYIQITQDDGGTFEQFIHITCLLGNQCCSGVNCDDGNPCTNDTCNATYGCQHSNVADGTACDDGKACTTSDHCSGGTCVGTNTCDDGNPCTYNTCTTSGCTYPLKPVGTACCESPDNPCTTANPCGTCNDVGVCGSGSGPHCMIGAACGCGGTCGRTGSNCSCQ